MKLKKNCLDFAYQTKKGKALKHMKKHIANILTACRIFGSALLLLFPAFSLEFYIIYILCGFSDMIDGTIARRCGSASEFGARLDTTADLVFVMVSMIKILPTMDIPDWLWIWGAVIAAIKIGSIILGYAYEKQFISLHTVMNKITGALLFVLPLILPVMEVKYSLAAICFTATLAAIEEVFYIAANRVNK